MIAMGISIMTQEEHKAAIAAAIEAALADAYARGYDEGGQAALKGVVEAATKAITPTLSAAADAVTSFQRALATVPETDPEYDPAPKAKRAPKGLTEAILKRVLAHGVSLSEAEIQRRAVDLDSRISPKTIYNDLRRKTEIYEQNALGSWKLVQTDPDTPQEGQQMEAPM